MIKVDLPDAEGSAFTVRDEGGTVTLPAQPCIGLGITIKHREADTNSIVIQTADGRVLGELGRNESVQFESIARRRGLFERLIDFLFRRAPRTTAWIETRREAAP